MEIDSTESHDPINPDEQLFHQQTGQIMCRISYDLQVLSQTSWTSKQRRQLEQLRLSLNQLGLIGSNQLYRRPGRDSTLSRQDFCLTWLFAAVENDCAEILAGKRLRYDLERALPLHLCGDPLRLRLLWKNLLSLVGQDIRIGWLISLRAQPEADGRVRLNLELTSNIRQEACQQGAFWPDFLNSCCRDLASMQGGLFSCDQDGYRLSLTLTGNALPPRYGLAREDDWIRLIRRGRVLLLSSLPFRRLHLTRMLESLALRVDFCESVFLARGMLDQAEERADPYTLCIADWQDALFLELILILAREPRQRQPELMLSLSAEDWPLLPLDYIAALLPAHKIAYLEQPCSLTQLLAGLRRDNLLYSPDRAAEQGMNLIDSAVGLARTGAGRMAFQDVLLRLENELPLLLRGIEQDDPRRYLPALQELEEISHFIGAESLLPLIRQIRRMNEQDEPARDIKGQRQQLLQQLKYLPEAVRQVCNGRGSLLLPPDLPAEKTMIDRLHWHINLRQIEHACRSHNRHLADTAIRALFGQRMRSCWQQALELMYKLLSEYEFSRICRICSLLQNEDEAALLEYRDLLRAADLPLTGEEDDYATDHISG